MDAANQHFGSDNYAGVCPEVWDALREGNSGHHAAYGEDQFTARAADGIRKTFETDCEVFFVFNGTAANSLALASLCGSYHSVICSEMAHIETDECGAPEFFSNGTKLLTVKDSGGKIDPAAVSHLRSKRTDIHYPKPRAVAITQSTELGTVYTPSEIKAICDTAHAPRVGDDHNAIAGSELAVHMDGARFANAAAALDVAPKEISWKVGIDVLSLGGTKLGMPVGEAVVFFKTELASEFAYRCKQAGQLASKMRFLAIPWIALLEKGLWLEYARRANSRAALLESLVVDIPGVRLAAPRQANAVFLSLPSGVADPLRKLWKFYTFIGPGSARFMCAWDTSEEDVKSLAADIRRLVPGGA